MSTCMRLARLSRRRLVKYLPQRQVQLSQVESTAAVIVELVKENVGRLHLRADPQAVEEAFTKLDFGHLMREVIRGHQWRRP